MTKEEKIKECWSKLYPNTQLKICVNTGFVITYCVNGISDLIDNSIINKEDIEWQDLDSDLIKWRPKSLSGIENNNGWIKIESEADLPKDKKMQYATCKNIKVFQTTVNFGTVKHWYNIGKITHYQPITKPEQPFY